MDNTTTSGFITIDNTSTGGWSSSPLTTTTTTSTGISGIGNAPSVFDWHQPPTVEINWDAVETVEDMKNILKAIQKTGTLVVRIPLSGVEGIEKLVVADPRDLEPRDIVKMREKGMKFKELTEYIEITPVPNTITISPGTQPYVPNQSVKWVYGGTNTLDQNIVFKASAIGTSGSYTIDK